MNVEEYVVSALGAALAVPVHGDVPAERPASFVTVERTGGGRTEHGIIDRPQLAVQSWAPTRAEALALSEDVDAAMHELCGSGPVRLVLTNSIYNFPAEGSARYQGVYDLVARVYD